MKIQDLINKHKASIRNDAHSIDYSEWVLYEYDVDWCPCKTMSLSDLLFSTQFLSLLEWNKSWLESRKHFCVWFVSYGCSSYNYHKINIALLNTDEERIEYIEENTI